MAKSTSTPAASSSSGVPTPLSPCPTKAMKQKPSKNAKVKPSTAIRLNKGKLTKPMKAIKAKPAMKVQRAKPTATTAMKKKGVKSKDIASDVESEASPVSPWTTDDMDHYAEWKLIQRHNSEQGRETFDFRFYNKLRKGKL